MGKTTAATALNQILVELSVGPLAETCTRTGLPSRPRQPKNKPRRPSALVVELGGLRGFVRGIVGRSAYFFSEA